MVSKIGVLVFLIGLSSSWSFASDKKLFSKRGPANINKISSTDLMGAMCKGLAGNYDLQFSFVEKGEKGEVSVTLGAGKQNEFEIVYNLDGTKATMTVLDSMQSNSLVKIVPQGTKNTMYFYCTK